jgi:streptomycin 3"-adenylyltransferase
MSIVTEKSLRKIRYPSPFELHYSDSWRDRFLNGEVDWNNQKYDEDLVMHYLAIRHRGIRLYGPAILDIFPDIPREMWIKSMVNDLVYIREQITTGHTTYAVLNPCRNLALIREGRLLSKKEGGEWALTNLPDEFIPIISQALADYKNNRGTFRPDKAELYCFLEYASSEMV